MLTWKTLANSDIPLVFIIDLFAKKTCQIEACSLPKLQFDELLTKICIKPQNICQITACDVQKLTVKEWLLHITSWGVKDRSHGLMG